MQNSPLDLEKPCIWVDADSFPSLAREKLQSQALNQGLRLIFVANRNIPFDTESPLFSMKICPAQKDAADTYISEHCSRLDIVATRDILFAKRLVQQGITCINDRGVCFDSSKLEKMLREKALSEQMQALGLHSSGKYDTYGQKEAGAFARCLDREINSKLAEWKFLTRK